jgi:hypothetical protein
MWVRGAAIRPVPPYAILDRCALERVSLRLREGPDTFAEAVRRFDREQPHLCAQMRRVLERPLDETVRAVGGLVAVSLWLAFKECFGSRLIELSREALLATEESLRRAPRPRGRRTS